MSIEKMHMVNLVGAINDFDKLTKIIVLEGCMQPVNALQEINSSDFLMRTREENIEALMDETYIRPYLYQREYNISLKHIGELTEALSIFNVGGQSINEITFNFQTMEKELSEVYDEYVILNKELEDLKEKHQEGRSTYEAINFLKNVTYPIEELTSMKNFHVRLYKVPEQNMAKLKANTENIPSIMETVYIEKGFVIFIAFTPILFIAEAERIFKSANCQEIIVPNHYIGIPKQVVVLVGEEINQLENSIEEVKRKLIDFLSDNYKIIRSLENSYELERKSSVIKNTCACTKEFFYVSGWVPDSLMVGLNKLLETFENKVVMVTKQPKEINNKDINPPTKLINNKLFKPFESMVRMYGVPSYNEMDPTMFLAITYTLMFGAMFGDVGQGLVLLLGGFVLRVKMARLNLGGVFERLGVSSIVFGFLYGSVFGAEHVIPALLIRPMENIEQMLIYAIVFGCIFLILGFVLGICNNIKRRNIEKGLFGKEGLAGFMFYIGALILVLSIVYKIPLLPKIIWVIYFALFLMMILLKKPLANIIMGKKELFENGAKDYFIEAGFEIIETLLSMFSNTLSFIRVGAFALNHVGLFVAFAAMASMSKNGVVSVLILIVGNVIIICLEGLIVFIQGLRLEYYELFSKYYEGSGVDFHPIQIKFK